VNKLTDFQSQLESVASSLGATLFLPDPKSGKFCMRLIRLPVDGPETIIDIKSVGYRYFVTTTRFIEPLRLSMKSFMKGKFSEKLTIPVEISSSECPVNEPMIVECKNESIYGLRSSFSSIDDVDLFYFFFTDSVNCVTATTTDVYRQSDELWQRIINRSYGTELIPPRRFSRRLTSNFSS
jgi:hypothetical protein|tara:strand:- start:1299 stop:1841 length:543 start_codon:yes stop_codon:yes gene_type:complete